MSVSRGLLGFCAVSVGRLGRVELGGREWRLEKNGGFGWGDVVLWREGE